MTACCNSRASRAARGRKTVLEIPEGATWSHEWLYTNQYGDPVDLSTGYEARAQVRARPSATAVLWEWDSDTANLDLTTDGRVVLTVEPAESSAWTWRRGVFDLEIIDPDGVVVRLDSGDVTVTPEVTR